jgi:hypothetical protein
MEIGAAPALIICQLDAGRIDDATQTVVDAGIDGQLPDLPSFIAVLLARMHVHAARGDHARALEDFAEALRRRERIGEITAGWIEDCLRAAEVHDAVGNHEEALALAADTLALARRWDTPGAVGQALRTQARLGAADDPIQTLQDAVALLERSPARLEHGGALVDLGGALRRRGHRRDTRDPLRAGYQLARECGADALVQQARTELAASGVRLRPPALRGADSLTASERRVTCPARIARTATTTARPRSSQRPLLARRPDEASTRAAASPAPRRLLLPDRRSRAIALVGPPALPRRATPVFARTRLSSRTSSEVGVVGGGCSTTRARARCACSSPSIRRL